MRRILFLYNNWEREHTIIERFSRELQKKKHVKVFQKKCFDVDLFPQLLKIRPHIIVTYPITTRRQIDIYMFAKICCHSIIITYTTEGLMDYHDEENIKCFAGMYDYQPELVDYHLFWGRAVARRLGYELYLQNKLLSKSQIRIIGNPMYEKDCHVSPEICTLMHDSREKILVLTGFDASLYSKKSILNLQDVVDTLGKSREEIFRDKMLIEYFDMIEQERVYCDKYISHIVNAARKHQEILFIVKLHPHEIASVKVRHMKLNYLDPLRGLENVKLIETSIPVSELLSVSRLMMHYGSTVDMESYIYRVPTLKLEQRGVINKHMIERCRRLTASTYYENIDDSGILDKYAEKIENGEELFQQNNEIEKQLYEYMNYVLGKPYHPSRRMAEFLCSDLIFHKPDVELVQRVRFIVKAFHSLF